MHLPCKFGFFLGFSPLTKVKISKFINHENHVGTAIVLIVLIQRNLVVGALASYSNAVHCYSLNATIEDGFSPTNVIAEIWLIRICKTLV